MKEKSPIKEEYISDRRWRLRGSGKFSQSKTSIQYVVSANRWEAKVKSSQKEALTWFYTLGKYSISDKNSITTGELLFEKKFFNLKFAMDKANMIIHLYCMTTIMFSCDITFVV